ncbi:MAG: ABC transporter permease [Actinomycetota bacterium]|nr:ABC transporter permease [Actinomycetota bacterium]
MRFKIKNNGQKNFLPKLKGSLIKKYGILIGFLFISIVISIITPNFLTLKNILNIMKQSSIIGTMAIGTTFVIIGGGFDISVGSLLALTSAMVLGLQSYIPWYLAVVVVLLVGAFIGFINGVLTAKVKIVAIIVTLGTMTILRGLTYLYTGGYPVIGTSESFQFIGSGVIGGIPFPIIIWIVMVIFWQFMLSKTKLGRYTLALGGNKEASRLSGVPVDFYLIMTFVIGGLMAALSGIIYASRINSVSPLAGQGYELDAIAATVIGGTSVAGGEGTVVGTLVGVLLLSVISNVFNLLGVQVYIQYVIKGVTILAVVGFDSYSRFRR